MIVAILVHRDIAGWTLPCGVVLRAVLVLGAIPLQSLTKALAKVAARALEGMAVVVLREEIIFYSFL